MEEQSPRTDLHFDYEKTVEVFKLLSDIRFKLLAFVPTIVGAAIALIGDNRPPGVMIGVGALGLCGTIGILLYELRNSELYNQAIHRAKYLECLQNFPTSVRPIPDPDSSAAGTATSKTGSVAAHDAGVTPGLPPDDKQEEHWPENGGVFSERRRGGYAFLGGVPVQHDIGLAFVYSAAVAGWVYLIARGVTAIISVSEPAAFSVALGFATALGLVTWTEVFLHDRSQFKPVRPNRTYETPKRPKWTRTKSFALAVYLLAGFLVLGVLSRPPRSHSPTPGVAPRAVSASPPKPLVGESQPPELAQVSGLLWVAAGLAILSVVAGLAMLSFSKNGKIAGGATAAAGLAVASLLGGVQIKLDDLFKMENRLDINPSLVATLNRMGMRAPIKIGDIRGFTQGQAVISDSMAKDFDGVCTSWNEHVKDGGLLMLIGSTDRTPLRAEARQRYESNIGLARSRAEAVKMAVNQRCGVLLQQMFTTITGPSYTPALVPGEPPSKGAEADRHVEVWAFWNAGSALFEIEAGKTQQKKEALKRE